MGLRYKYDRSPLLAPGRHYLTLEQLYGLCVARFPGNRDREHKFHKVEEMVQQFLIAEIPCEMWIDGSFLTEKPDPGDVDIVVKIGFDVSEALTSEQRQLVDAANDIVYIEGIDSFVFVAYPRDHEFFGSEIDDRETWAEQFGLEHSEVWLKGLAVLRLRETNVGLRIRR
ncbi:DUF6932 family protein [Microvirga splendida]|uniref:Polymerase nucleotidyl transferase domain-containing protein n=1 Tax=Microvirga splendida TaxID=2795727 RepID=A0ABS0XXK0_9HYPH|nr:hypothetical protein [Microvirga splendida]MBJ6124778.1 hypothetical protein [Microvirga splendida]